VIQDGKPLDDALVIVHHDLGFAIGGKTDSKGVAVITADGRWPGIPEGEFIITVSKITAPPDLPLPGPSSSVRERREMMDRIANETTETVDLKYSDAKKSELRLKVGKKAVNETFDVGAAVAVSMAELSPGVRPM